MDCKSKPRVCIVGAGVSGLCTCRHLSDRGLHPVVLEANSHVGGIWKTAAVSITKLQSPTPVYQFAEFPWAEGVPPEASAQQVLEYLESYAKHFGVFDKIRFNTKVVSIKKQGSDEDGNLGTWDVDDKPWEVTIENGETLEFDFVILSMGRFGDVPNIPSFPPGKGPEVFKGKTLHSLEYSKMRKEVLADKRVAVVGFSKSALDIAMEAATVNQGPKGYPCSLVFRAPHWILETHRVFGMPLAFLFCSRFAEMLVPKPGQVFLSATFSRMLYPLRWCISKLCETYLCWNLPLAKYGLVPPLGFSDTIQACNIVIKPDNFFEVAEQGLIEFNKSFSWHYYKQGLVLDNGKQVEADVVILATGFKGEAKIHSILQKKYTDVLKESGGVAALFRGVVHPHIPNLAFIGYQEDLSNLRMSEMGARWVSYLVDEKFKLPNVKTMEKTIHSWVKFMKSTAYQERPCLASVMTWHSDELCRDMGWKPKRKNGWFQELFVPYTNMDYED